MRRLWLIFSQTATVCLALLFVISTLKPEWLPGRGDSSAAPPAQMSILSTPSLPVAVNPRATASFSDAVEKAAPSVVNVFTSKEVRSRNPMNQDPLFRRFFGDEAQRSSSLGSGVIVSANGYILTNNHVVDAADEIEVALADGKRLIAKVVGNDPDSDLAVLRVNAEGLPVATFGQSDALRVGDVVLAIGNPLGVGQTVTSGIVSALRRTGLGINTFEDFIQTDAAINSGNSGGALIDAQGNLVGINSAILSQSGGSIGIGFAIPVSTAKMVLEQIVKTGSVTRGWIGVEAQEITSALAESLKLPDANGAMIAGVLRGGPAEKAGVKPGDVLTAIDGRPVTDSRSMLNLVAALAPGSNTTLKVRRSQDFLDLTIVVGKRPKPQTDR